jgi:hypothetical protein
MKLFLVKISGLIKCFAIHKYTKIQLSASVMNPDVPNPPSLILITKSSAHRISEATAGLSAQAIVPISYWRD